MSGIELVFRQSRRTVSRLDRLLMLREACSKRLCNPRILSGIRCRMPVVAGFCPWEIQGPSYGVHRFECHIHLMFFEDATQLLGDPPGVWKHHHTLRPLWFIPVWSSLVCGLLGRAGEGQFGVSTGASSSVTLSCSLVTMVLQRCLGVRTTPSFW